MPFDTLQQHQLQKDRSVEGKGVYGASKKLCLSRPATPLDPRKSQAERRTEERQRSF